MAEPPALHLDGPDDAPACVALAHGAGVGFDSPFMTAFAEGLAGHGLRVARFEFPYMTASREDGRRRPPDPAPRLLATWRAVVDALGGPEGLVVGGKSMGGRMAADLARTLADEGTPVAGVACLGYPFHPPGKPAQTRLEALRAGTTPVLICQGTRDPFGGTDEVAGYALPDTVEIAWAADGDHHLVPRARSGRTCDETWAEAIARVADFARRVV